MVRGRFREKSREKSREMFRERGVKGKSQRSQRRSL